MFSLGFALVFQRGCSANLCGFCGGLAGVLRRVDPGGNLKVSFTFRLCLPREEGLCEILRVSSGVAGALPWEELCGTKFILWFRWGLRRTDLSASLRYGWVIPNGGAAEPLGPRLRFREGPPVWRPQPC